MSRKRRPRNYRGTWGRKQKVSYMPVIVMLCLSIGCGYATAKYVVQPVVNYVPQMAGEKQSEKKISTQSQESLELQGTGSGTAVQTGTQQNAATQTPVIEGDADVKPNGKVSGYALQFGCYSSQAAADRAKGTLQVSGLQVLKQNEMYKLVSECYDSKRKAKAALQTLPENVDAFVTPIYQ